MNIAESHPRNKEGAPPPRLPFGAPSRRTQLATTETSVDGHAESPTVEAPLTAPGADAVPVSQSGDVKSLLLAAPSLLRRIFSAPVKLLWGMVFCQSVLGALAVLGWTYRLMQRSVLKQWWKLSESSARAGSFAEFVAGDIHTDGHVHWPNWFLAQNFRGSTSSLPSPDAGRGQVAAGVARRSPVGRLFGNAARMLKALFTSLWTNVRLGVQAIFTTWVLTLPACVLMLFGWYDGWNNSFNKGYEQFQVGPGVSWLGILLFIAAMLYVPMAQARQAVTGNWRGFYQFRLVWTLVRRRWLACFGLATLYVLCSVPLMILASAVMFLPNISPKLADLTPAQTIQVLNGYYFWSALFVFPAFVMLRLVAARTYGSALLKAVQGGAISQDALAENEWQAMHRLDLLRVEPPRIRHPVWRIAAWAGTRAGRATFGFLTGLAWFIFIAQFYVAQFVNYRGAPVWLNQTLVQLPWFHHIPASLKNPWGDFIGAAVVVFLASRLAKLVHWVKCSRQRHDPAH